MAKRYDFVLTSAEMGDIISRDNALLRDFLMTSKSPEQIVSEHFGIESL